ncbi:MAG: MerR family transcriptional regulator [Tateyamaria sp.]
MSKSADAFRTISEVADWLGVQSHVLRFWESKFPQVKPVKRAGGRRYYRPPDMLLLGGIRKLLHEDGLTIKGVQKLLREEGVAHVSDMSLPLDDDTSAVLEGDLVTHQPQPPETPQPAPPASVVSIYDNATSLEADADDTDEQANDPLPDGIDHTPINTLQREGPFSDDDDDDDDDGEIDAPYVEEQAAAPPPAQPIPVPSFMSTPKLDAEIIAKEERGEDVPILTPDFTPDLAAPAVAETNETEPNIETEPHVPTEPEEQGSLFGTPPGPFETEEQDQANPSQQVSALDSTPEPIADVTPEADLTPGPTPADTPQEEPQAAPTPLFHHFKSAEPDAPTSDAEPEFEPIPDAVAAESEQPVPAPVVKTDAPAPIIDEQAPAPETVEQLAPESVVEPSPETVEQPAPVAIVRPRIVDVPDDDNIDETGIKASVLTKSAVLSRLTPQQSDAIRPLVDQLTALRDQMANAHGDHN